MAHKRRRQRQHWECGHSGFGKFCHFCRDKQAGKPVGIKKARKGKAGGNRPGETPAKPKTWKRARCPFCNGTRVKRNDFNVMSAVDAKEYSCKEFACGKEFNEEQVKTWDEVEVSGR